MSLTVPPTTAGHRSSMLDFLMVQKSAWKDTPKYSPMDLILPLIPSSVTDWGPHAPVVTETPLHRPPTTETVSLWHLVLFAPFVHCAEAVAATRSVPHAKTRSVWRIRQPADDDNAT